jgi:hypothetical protein
VLSRFPYIASRSRAARPKLPKAPTSVCDALALLEVLWVVAVVVVGGMVSIHKNHKDEALPTGWTRVTMMVFYDGPQILPFLLSGARKELLSSLLSPVARR